MMKFFWNGGWRDLGMWKFRYLRMDRGDAWGCGRGIVRFSEGIKVGQLWICGRRWDYKLMGWELEIIEEAPAPGLSKELKRDFAEKAVAAAKAVD
jgi:hypothetical protein